MTCWVCKRHARGFGHTDHRFGVGHPRRYPTAWIFCSRRCQHVFQQLYGNLLKVRAGQAEFEETAMIDATAIERAAMRHCLKPFGEAAGEIGFDKPLGAYSEAEALQVIEAIVTAYTEAMVEHHAASQYPPVRGLPPVPDPLDSPFRDLEDPAMWGGKP